MALRVNEIFYSIQGESSFAGQPCVFIRLAGCNLRCSYCDTQYAYDAGAQYDLGQLVDIVQAYQCPLVEITGGEPLLQAETPRLVDRLLARSLRVLVETNGSLDISKLSALSVRIVDIKCPSSGEQASNDLDNLARLSAQDELKFVISDRADYEFVRNILFAAPPAGLRSDKIHLAAVFGKLRPATLAKWILDDRLAVRLQLQLHKYIWNPEKRGV